MSVKAVILVGGPSRGTSFRPLSSMYESVPKPLFPLGGVPMILHPIQALIENIPTLQEILIIGFYEPTLFENFLESVNRRYSGRVSVKYLREFAALGTFGGIYHFRDIISRSNPKYLFVINADVCCSFPLAEMLEFHKTRPTEAICTIISTTVSKDVCNNFGVIVRNHDESGEVVHYVDKPSTFLSREISTGIYLFDREKIFKVMSGWEREPVASISDEDENDGSSFDKISLERDLLPKLIGKGVYAYLLSENGSSCFWRPIKTAASAVPANALYLGKQSRSAKEGRNTPSFPCEVKGPVSIHPTADIHPTAVIGPNVSIGEYCRIGPGVRIRNAIILPRVSIKENTLVLNSILCWDCKIGPWCRIEGSTDENSRLSATILSGDNSVKAEIHVRSTVVLPHKELKSSVHNEVLM